MNNKITTTKKYTASELINCKTAEEVREAVRKWSSDKSDEEHLIRSAILDMHAGIEKLLKQVLYWHILNILFQDGDEKEDEKRRKYLERTINKMGFNEMYRILKPCLDSFPAPDLQGITEVNNVRNIAAHGDIKDVEFKGSNPFTDHEALADYFLSCWAIKKELRHFYERMIDDPKALAKVYYDFYRKNN